MKFLAVDKILAEGLPTDGPPSDEVTAEMRTHLKAEMRAAWELYASGVVREMYSRADRPGAVFIIECDSVYDARNALDSLPLVKQGLVDYEIIPLGPFAPLKELFAE